MKDILLVVENASKMQLMLEKALRFLPQSIDVLFLDNSIQSENKDVLHENIDQIVNKQCKVQFIFEPESTQKTIIEKLESLPIKNNIELVMLYKPKTEEGISDFSIIKTMLKQRSKATIFLCGDNPWQSEINILSTIDIEEDDKLQRSLNKRVLNVAIKIAEQLNAKLQLLSIIPINRVSQEFVITEPSDVLSAKGKTTKAKLEQFVEQEVGNVSASFHVAAGSVHREIPYAAKKLKSSLVLLGNVGRTGITGLIIGNTAEKILSRLTIDALIVKE